LPEIVDESVGTLFRPADPEDLAEKLVALLNRSDLAETGRRARARVVDHWSLERLARRHQAIYKELVEEKKR
jgi:glycosyltransferase involved in cell wall biosynthesis